jgi:hypothetical protein
VGAVLEVQKVEQKVKYNEELEELEVFLEFLVLVRIARQTAKRKTTRRGNGARSLGS